MSTCHQTTDYRFHQSSINNKQAAIDADGKVRVIALLIGQGQ
jgi:hypothetical protein